MNVVVLSGRRTDPENASTPRFPLDHAPAVREQIQVALRDLHADLLVCSASCGADLLALDIASDLYLRAEVMLPFSREEFRTTSVVDRPGDWGPLFDRLVEHASGEGALTIVDRDPAMTNHDTYRRLMETLVHRALERSHQNPAGSDATRSGSVTAIAVWDGAPRDPGDHTAHFIEVAKSLGVPVRTIFT